MSECGDFKNFCDKMILNIASNRVGYQKRPHKCSNFGQSFISLDVIITSQNVISQNSLIISNLPSQESVDNCFSGGSWLLSIDGEYIPVSYFCFPYTFTFCQL